MRRRRRRSSDQVELNLAAMLDMAFQLLAFFILTFRPAAVEVELRMNLPNQTVLAIMDAPESVPSTTASSSTPVVAAIPIFVEASPGGQVSAVRLGQRPIFSGPTSDAKLGLLSRELGLIVSLPGGLMKVQINVAGQLGYEEFMKIVDVCLRQKLSNGEPLRDVSYQILPK
jgi:biopolymer transport protein ExbD